MDFSEYGQVMDFSEYGQAVIHLAWYRNDNICYLLFGMVELRPSELPRALGCSQKSSRVGREDRKYVHYKRFAVSVCDATRWYKGVVSGRLVFPNGMEDAESVDELGLHGGPFVQEPRWPGFVTSSDLVFAPDWMHGSRTHFLFPKEVLSSEIEEAITKEKIRSKLEEWLNFDIALAYPDYQGSLCLVAPNPLFRTIDRAHREQPHPGVAYKIVVRAGQRPNGLRLMIVDERLRGRMALMDHEFGSKAIAKFDYLVEVHKEGKSVTHPDHGLLCWHEPLSLIRTINVGMEVYRRTKSVRVHSAGRRWPEYEYDVEEVENGGEVSVGDVIDDVEVFSRLINEENRRTRRRAAEDHDQKWFYRAPADAAQYVRSKIGNAQKSILIVDPYFSSAGLMAFGHAICRPNVDMRILTSADGLKESANTELDSNEGSILQKALNETFDKMSAKPEIRVLPGESPPIHDRFLVIDEEVWFSGNSLSTLGKRAGMIVKLSEPETVISQLEAFWVSSRVLSNWLSDRGDACGKG